MAAEFRLLGTVEIYSDGQVVDAGEPRRRAVLAALVFDAGQVVPSATLVDRVWGDEPPAQAVKTLSTHITRIRRALSLAGDGGQAATVVCRAGGYRLTVDREQVDLHRFRRLTAQARSPGSTDRQRVDLLREALSLFRGPPLTGIPGDWAARTREHLARERLDATAAWAQAELAIGNPAAVIAPLAPLADEHPTMEHLTAVLVRALVADGRPGDALKRCRAHRQRLLAELGTDPSGELQALYQAILRGELAPPGPPEASIPVAAGQATRRLPPPAPPTAERTLPADVTGFVGRHDELRHLFAAVTEAAGPSGAEAVLAVDGMAGVGKTAFAVHAAHLLADRFPDGQRFVALRAHAPGQAPVEPAAALETLLQADGVAAAQIPSSLDARTGLWRDRMAGKRLLLVLDDAADTGHVAPLLPATPGCLVLITSRRKLTTLPNTVMMSLDTLPAGHAVDLFVTRARRGRDDPAAVARIVALCGNLPLAITLAAARMHTHAAWSVADLADDLAATRDRLGELASGDLAVGAAFDLSYRGLPPSRQRLIRRLGLHPGTDVDAYAVAALDAVSLAEARRGLESLLEHNLVTEPHRGRYRMHDLVAEHARVRADGDPAAERDLARDRLLEFYLHTATVAAGYLARHATRPADGLPGAGWPAAGVPPVAGPEQATGWFASEQANLAAVAGWAAAHGRTRAAIGIPAALHEHLRANGPWHLALDLHRAALSTARRVADLPAQARALADMADVQRLAGDYPAAAVSAGQAREAYRQLGDRHGEAGVLHTLGQVQRLTDDYAAAAVSAGQALDLYRRTGDRIGEADAHYALSYVQLATGDYAAAATSAGRALDLSRELSDRYGQANALSTLGVVANLTGDNAASSTDLGRALDLYREIGDRRGQANTLATLGFVRYVTGDHPAATTAAEHAFELYRQLGDRIGQANALTTLGLVRRATGDHAAAAAAAERALGLYRQLGGRHGEANALLTLGLVRHATGDHPAAVATLERALDLYREVEDPDGQAEALNHLGELSLTTATTATARHRFAEALAIARTIGAPSHEARSLEGIGTCALREGRRDEAVTRLREALVIYRRIRSPNVKRVEAAIPPDGSGN